MVTVALPVWNNERILWLPLEGLSRQSGEWELIVSECPGDNRGREIVENYAPRLRAAGCVKITYLLNSERMALGMKWRQMAQRAQGEMMMLQASDEYPHPGRVETAWKYRDYSWYDCRYAYTWSFNSRALVKFDKFSEPRWKTGYDIAIKTKLVKALPKNNMRKGVDFWLHENCAVKVFTDGKIYPGVATNGLNSISLNRERHFKRPVPPFQKSDRKIHELGLPGYIVNKLLATLPEKAHERLGGAMVKVLMNGKVKKVLPEYLDMLDKKNMITYIDKKIVEPIDIEI